MVKKEKIKLSVIRELLKNERRGDTPGLEIEAGRAEVRAINTHSGKLKGVDIKLIVSWPNMDFYPVEVRFFNMSEYRNQPNYSGFINSAAEARVIVKAFEILEREIDFKN